MKHILIVRGGGRANGNTAQLAQSFFQGARDAGHQAELISLSENKVNGCLGCNACRYGKPCIQKDSFHSLVPKIKAADLIVFASPLYFWTFSSQLKRITVHYNFSGLSDSEVAQYILHKIACAGGAPSIIDQAALSAVHSHSQGSPRLVDNLMTDALTLGAQMDKKVIDTDVILASVSSQNLG